MVRIYDSDGGERDWAWVAAQGYGLYPEDVVACPGYGFQLAEIRETRGPSDLHFVVQEQDGSISHDQVYAARWWPQLQPDPDQPDVVTLPAECKTVPGQGTRLALVQRAGEASGEGGWGLGGGDVIKEGHGNSSICIASLTYPSAIVRRIGWLGGTEHWGLLRYVFRLGPPAGGEPPPPPTDGTVEALIQDALDELAGIEALRQAALGKLQAALGKLGGVEQRRSLLLQAQAAIAEALRLTG